MPYHTITVHPKDEITVNEDWGRPVGIKVGDLTIDIIGTKSLDSMLCALEDLRRAREDRERELAGEPSEAEVLSACGPELAGFEAEVA